MPDIYYAPEKHGLKTIGEIDWSDGCYQFDYTVVWQRLADGQLLYGEDSGCSCPSPFEDQGADDLTACTWAELQAHLQERGKDNYDGDRAAEVGELMHRVLEAIAIPGRVIRDQAAITSESGRA
jgi:hypothetical protein